jgi:hypothetical protein
MRFVFSDGGPLIAIPKENAKAWFGTDPSPDMRVPDGWEWSGDDDDPVRTDYDRACGKLRAYHESNYGGVGLLKVGDGDALVFDAPTDTTFVTLKGGGAFLRNVAFRSPKQARTSLLEATKWKKTRIEIALTSGRMVLFDAAYPYKKAPAKLNIAISKGRYRIEACDFFPSAFDDYECRAYRLKRG